MTTKTARKPVMTATEKFQQALDLHRQGHLEQAETHYQEFLRTHPKYPAALHLLGVIALQREQFQRGIDLIDQALAINPRDADAHSNLGNGLRKLDRLEEALASYDRALTLKPDHAEAINNRGTVLQALNRSEEALDCYEQAIRLKPDYFQAHTNRGNALQDLKRYEEALASYDQALRLKPDSADALNNRGISLRSLKRLEEALANYERAAQFNPRDPVALNNRGLILQDLKRMDEAMACYALSLQLRPDYAEAHWNDSLLRLRLGDFDEGWKKYEWRWLKTGFTSPRRDFTQPLWLGQQSLQGKTILLHSEQGAGDTIQFCRYTKLVAAQGATVVLEVQASLVSLLARLEGASQVLAKGEPLPAFDYHCPLLSLPLAFHTRLDTIPAEPAYLKADPACIAAWQNRLGERTLPRIGLVWSGNAKHTNDHNRSIPLADFIQLAQGSAQFISLQKEVRPADQAVLDGRKDIAHYGDELVDFAETAGLVAHLDIVISVDTSVAHLAAALGKPVWVLLPFIPDWRWLLDRDDNPWYPSVRVFRQQTIDDWQGPITEIARALAATLPPADASTQWKQAVDFHRQGRLAEAEAFYEAVLQSVPGHLGSLHMLGVIALQTGRTERGIALIRQVLTAKPDDANAHSNLGNGLRDLNRPQEALAHYTQALRLQPQHIDSLKNRGIVLQELGRRDEALADYDSAVRLEPNDVETWVRRGNVLRDWDRLEEALASYEQALRINPKHLIALDKRGMVLRQLDRPELALASFALALQIKPDDTAALIHAGLALQTLKRPQQALAYFDEALRHAPDSAEAWLNRGNVLKDSGRLDDALASYTEALRCRPDYVSACYNIGVVLYGMERYEEALRYYRRALDLQPDHIEALNNCGATLRNLRRPQEALACYTEITRLKPDYTESFWNESLARLVLGDFAEGWKKYETRWELAGFTSAKRTFTQPLWLGKESVRGKTLLLHAEQGLGDTIQFCRYAKQVAALGATVLLEVQAPLKTLLSGLEGVARLLVYGETLPAFDYHCPLLSLPLALGTRLETIPADIPYLRADPNRVAAWQRRLGERILPRIGLVWSGSATHKIDHKRSIPLADFARLAQAKAQFISLQKEVRPADRMVLDERQDIAHYGNELTDFAETAALIAHVDLVITVDTSVAHLAAALGKPVWVLLPFNPDWRWLLDRTDSPWYPGIRLFRQKALDDWQGPMTEATDALAAFLETVNVSEPWRQAISLHRQGRLTEAEALYEAVLRARPTHFDSLHMLGVIALQTGRTKRGVALIRQAIAITPDRADAHSNLGNGLRDLKCFDEALARYDHALRLKPDYAEALNNRGIVLQDLNRLEEALLSFDQALRLQPDYVDAITNRGNALRAMKRLHEALDSYAHALRLKPDDPQIRWNESLTHLLAGEFKQGWVKHESRWQKPGFTSPRRNFSPPLWLGQEPLQGKTILLHAEQGLGDTIQFCRYAKKVAALGATVLLEVQAPLKSLLSGLDGVERLFVRGETLPAFDYHCPLLSLPLAFDTRLETIPAEIPYLRVDPERVAAWQAKLGERTRPRIGLVWSGSTIHPNDHNRSVPLAQFARLIQGQAQFISLQKELRPADQSVLDGYPNIVHYGDELTDFVETAALIANLDRVISVDTAVAHCAAALGKPVWLLLPFMPDWRWLLERSDSPWYPATVRLFRQQTAGDWDKVLHEVAEALDSSLKPADIAQAIQWHSQGRLDEAEQRYEAILRTRPNHFDALHMLGVIALQTGRTERGVALIRQAIAIQPNRADAHSNLGSGLRQLNRIDEALASYGEALRLQPGHLDALKNRGLMLHEVNRPAEALADYDLALRLKPGNADTLAQRGNALQSVGRLEEALLSYDQALQVQPHHAVALNNRSVVLRQLNRPQEALACYDQVLQLKPDDAVALNNRGLALQNLKRLDEALADYDAALRVNADYVDALLNRGNVLKDLGRLEEALASYAEALRLKPGYALASFNSGVVWQGLNRHEEALACYRRAVELQPNYVEALNNCGAVLKEMQRPAEAMVCYQEALRLKPDYVHAQWNASLVRLLLGDFAEGWKQYEWRWKTETFIAKKRDFKPPLWLGQASLQGKTILLHAEQGLGDTIQFCRYAKNVAALGATVRLEVQAPLKSLLTGLDGVANLLVRGEALPEFDYHCPLLSLPLAFETRLETIPAEIPYLRTDPKRVAAWQAKLGEHAKPRIGLAWSGNAEHPNDRNRSIPLAKFARLVQGQAHFISLQKELRPTDCSVLDGYPNIAHYGGELTDFVETAALIAHLDLVVSVDTSVAHCAAALGKPVWLLLPFDPDWRWLLGRDDSPWYPTVKLFRQPSMDDWDSVFARIADALAAYQNT